MREKLIEYYQSCVYHSTKNCYKSLGLAVLSASATVTTSTLYHTLGKVNNELEFICSSAVDLSLAGIVTFSTIAGVNFLSARLTHYQLERIS